MVCAMGQYWSTQYTQCESLSFRLKVTHHMYMWIPISVYAYNNFITEQNNIQSKPNMYIISLINEIGHFKDLKRFVKLMTLFYCVLLISSIFIAFICMI